MLESLLNPMPASFIHLGFSVRVGGIVAPAWAVTFQLDFLQPHSLFDDKPYIGCHLVFLLEPGHLEQIQVQVLKILGWLPHHVGLLSNILRSSET
uniref:Uncharacterized protein n=1 Tax=Triticum urartu TaxID=4572 RepID=A0A8R7QPM4_TRIUA